MDVAGASSSGVEAEENEEPEQDAPATLNSELGE
jgi:hypothetical protein